jgi:ADP-ribose pyrophosphatase
VKREPAYRGRSLCVWADEVELPNGRRVTLDVVRHPGAAAVVPFVGDEDVLLIRQFRHAAGGMILEVPAGKLAAGEDPAVCAARELEEEAGQRAGRIERLGEIWTTPGFTDERIHLFARSSSSRSLSVWADEVIEVLRVPLVRALELVWSGELSDAKSALALLHAARRLGRLRA